MGKVRPTKVKRLATELLQKYPDQFSEDFEKNKQLVKQFLPEVTKKMRNRVAGYVTRLMAIRLREAKASLPEFSVVQTEETASGET